GNVCELTFAQVRALDASVGLRRRHEGRGSYPRTGIPALGQALDLLRGRCLVDVEIKNLPDEPDFDSPDEAVASTVVKMIDDMAMQPDVVVTSFNWLSIERVRTLDERIATGFLTPPSIDARAALVYARGAGHAFVLPHAYALDEAGEGFVE